MKPKPAPPRLLVNAEPLQLGRTLSRKMEADFTDPEIALLCAVAMARSPGKTTGLDDDFESARVALCATPQGFRPRGQPANALEDWLKVFMRHPDAALAIMAKARACDMKHSQDPVFRAARELPANAPTVTVSDTARRIDPKVRPDEDTVKKTMGRLRKMNREAFTPPAKRGQKTRKKSPFI